MLWRGHFKEEKIIGETKRGEEADEDGWQRRDSARSLYVSFEIG